MSNHHHHNQTHSTESVGSGDGDIYTCPMHPEVVSDESGSCPKCGMTLVKKQMGEPGMEHSAHAGHEASPSAWKNYHIGFVIYALVFIAFDMEMIFMYPWAVAFKGIGLEAFLDMFVFIAILSLGLVYMWLMGGFKWEK